jgi:hypothetical protein
MIRRLSSVKTGLLLLTGVVCINAQTPAPPVPPLTKEQKEAAAAVEAPKTFTPPPAPGQLQSNTPAKTEAPAKAPEPPKAVAPPPVPPPVVPVPPAGNSASKMQALEAITQQPAVREAPRVTAPSDKAAITTSTSTTGQFVVHGKVFETRSAMSSRCEEISQELRKVLNDKEPFVIPVVVVLNTGEEATKSTGTPISTAVTELTHGGFHLQVTLNERPGLKIEDLRKEVVRALLAERILRNRTKIVTPEGRLLLPDWVMTGVLLGMDYKASARPSAMFSTIFRSGKIYGIEEIISASPVAMDGLSRTIYEASCCALVLALVDQPNGPQNFNKFLNALASDPRSERELLNVTFPNFAASASSLNKWWALQLAALSKPGIAEPFSPAESFKAIEDAIQIRYEAKPDEVPQNIKPRPFVLPQALIVASNEPKPEPLPPIADEMPKPKARDTSDTASASAPVDEPAQEKPKRPLWRRLLFLGPAESESEPAETTVAENAPEPSTEKKPGLLSRLFGGSGSEEKKTEANIEPVAKPVTPAEMAKPEEPMEEKKPSMFNPFNWFRGDKKPAEEKKDEQPAKDEQPPATSSSLDVARLLAPSLADAWQFLAPEAPRPTIEPLFRRKRKPTEEKASETKTAEESKKAESKPAVKKDSNPNSKPASKPAASSGEPRTNNPNSKPVPAGMVPPATVGTASGTAAKSSGLVPVTLPLEEYKHILKHPDRVQILNYNVAALRALELRVSVLFRPVVTAYLSAMLDLQEGKTKDMDKRLATLRQFAAVAYQKSIAVRDYLDFYEASENGRLSGKFDDYLNLPQIIEKELPPRTDPISKYLDAIDKEFSKN